MLGIGICEKYQLRDEKFPEPKGEGNLFSKLVFFSQIPLPNMIYLFNYTEYYLEHWLNKYLLFVVFRNILFVLLDSGWSILNEFGGLMHARVKKLNSHANTPAAVKMNEINPKYEYTRKIQDSYIRCNYICNSAAN